MLLLRHRAGKAREIGQALIADRPGGAAHRGGGAHHTAGLGERDGLPTRRFQGRDLVVRGETDEERRFAFAGGDEVNLAVHHHAGSLGFHAEVQFVVLGQHAEVGFLREVLGQQAVIQAVDLLAVILNREGRAEHGVQHVRLGRVLEREDPPPEPAARECARLFDVAEVPGFQVRRHLRERTHIPGLGKTIQDIGGQNHPGYRWARAAPGETRVP